MNFWHSLNDKKLISNDEAMHGLILFYCNKDLATTYEQRVERLKQDKLLSNDFKGLENEAITRGELAAMLAKNLKIKGGVMMHLLGPQPRYALKEMVALRIFPESSPQQVLNGAQLIEIMGRVEDYQYNIQKKAPAEKLDGAQSNQASTSNTTDDKTQKDQVQPQSN